MQVRQLGPGAHIAEFLMYDMDSCESQAVLQQWDMPMFIQK